ncbi:MULTISPECIES: MFS transporter [Oceanobacillus]|uniref:Transporter YoaB n=1 Tax=Oceanobacillus kimchii TaxID=746691 RepID=A0ABQ5TLX7_9BACI|nr:MULTISPECIES: MFS transporter [Oceanobacillus]MBT2598143.1 MFS transporter [Oceanobacillus sp. ISL-74]MBT2651062.1 MFS transporter [Oceanobacillus sp. ISL-73]MCT1575726.1 MFS transporter [Oceanobacillus kimchii]MCT2135363.1 MFS transporter [Oceanobacillus kimchii]OEH55470.1 alpha-ketoglutarate permease [Oceanobacillus sp. E9]
MRSLGQNQTFLDKIGIPSNLVWGYFGVLIFMMGDGLELAWISPYLVDQGLTVQQAAVLTTSYGVTIAIAAWLSGVLVEAFGPRKTMTMGLVLYLLGHVLFVGFAMPNLVYELMIPTYALRGFGYPLFAYSFLVWVTYRTPKHQLGTAVGWFWFVFTGGLSVLGAYYSSFMINWVGHIPTMWSAVFWVLLGAYFALIVNKDKFDLEEKESKSSKFKELLNGITILKREPKVAVAGIVRIINQASQYAFPLFLPIYLSGQGISTTVWLNIWGTIFISNIAFNLIFGYVGDKFGWRNTITWIGAVGCGVFTLMMFYVPQVFTGNVFLIGAIGMLWGACLAGFVPLSALTPSLVGDGDKGAAMSILNLGAGLCVFVGPALVALFYDFIGTQGLMWLLAGLYFAAAIMTRFLRLPEEEIAKGSKDEAVV